MLSAVLFFALGGPNASSKGCHFKIRPSRSHIFVDIGLKLSYIPCIEIICGSQKGQKFGASRSKDWAEVKWKQIPAGKSPGRDREDLMV